MGREAVRQRGREEAEKHLEPPGMQENLKEAEESPRNLRESLDLPLTGLWTPALGNHKFLAVSPSSSYVWSIILSLGIYGPSSIIICSQWVPNLPYQPQIGQCSPEYILEHSPPLSHR